MHRQRKGSTQRLLDLQSPKSSSHRPATDRPSRSQRHTPSQPLQTRTPSRPSPHPKAHRRSSDRVRSSPLTKPPRKVPPQANRPKPTTNAKSTTRPSKPAHTLSKQDRGFQKTHRSAAAGKARQPSATREVIRAITGTSLQRGKQEIGKRIVELLARLARKGTKKRTVQHPCSRVKEAKQRYVDVKRVKMEGFKGGFPRKVLTSSLPTRTKPVPMTRYTHALEAYSGFKRSSGNKRPPVSRKYRSESQKQVSHKQTHPKHIKGKTESIPPFQQPPFLPLPRPFLPISQETSQAIRRPKPLDSPEPTPVSSRTYDSVEREVEQVKAASPAGNYYVRPVDTRPGPSAGGLLGSVPRGKTDGTSRKGEEIRPFEGVSTGFPQGKEAPKPQFPSTSSRLQSTPKAGIASDSLESEHLCELLVQGVVERLAWEVIHLPVMQVTVSAIGNWIAERLCEKLVGEILPHKKGGVELRSSVLSQTDAAGQGAGSIGRGRKPLVRILPLQSKAHSQ